jgi:hypothetical protein
VAQHSTGQIDSIEERTSGAELEPRGVPRRTVEDRLQAVDALLAQWHAAEECDPGDSPVEAWHQHS